MELKELEATMGDIKESWGKAYYPRDKQGFKKAEADAAFKEKLNRLSSFTIKYEVLWAASQP